MTQLRLCRLDDAEARHLGMAPTSAGGWIANHPAVHAATDAAVTAASPPFGDGAAYLALLPSDWAEASARPVDRRLGDAIIRILERVEPDADTDAWAKRIREHIG